MFVIYDLRTREPYALVASLAEVAKDLPVHLTVKDLGRDVDLRSEIWDAATLTYVPRPVPPVRDLFNELLAETDIARLSDGTKAKIVGTLQTVLDAGARFVAVESP